MGFTQISVQRVVPESYQRFSYALYPLVISVVGGYLVGQKDDMAAAVELVDSMELVL